MKYRALIPLILTLSLLGCQTPPADITPPAPTAEHTPVPTAAPTQTSTAEPIDDLGKYIDPSMKDTLRTAIGDAEFTELFASIGEKGEITGMDYGTGQKFEGTVVPESMVFKTTADWYFDTIVTASAKDKDGKEFKVVWNKDENHWVRAERTHFKNIDQMVETGDYNLVLLTQPEIGEPFPEGTEKARYFIKVSGGGIFYKGEGFADIFLSLGAIRADYDYDFTSSILARNTTFGVGRFTKGAAPQRSHGVDFATLKDGREIVIVPQVIQNADGKNIIVVTGIDPRYYDFLTGPNSIDKQGITDFQNALDGNRVRIVPVFPLDDPKYWDNFTKNDIGNGSMHSIELFGAVAFMDNVAVSILKPGEIFEFLPDVMKREIIEVRRLEQEAQDKGEKYERISPYLFENGTITPEFARALSRFIFEASFDKGFLEPAK